MTPKEHLSQVKRYHDLILEIELEIKMLQTTRDGLTGMSFDKELVQTSLTDTGLENQIILVEQKESRLKDLRKEYAVILKTVQEKINRLTVEGEQKVLKYRYIRFMEWADICTQMNKTQDAVFALHKRALNHYKV